MAYLEHVNVTVKDAKQTAALFVDLFDWHVRWEGASIHDGYSVHVGGTESYVALYNNKGGDPTESDVVSYDQKAGLNHIAVVVDDLDAVEEKVKAHNFESHSHADYEPGRRFYFHDDNGLEIEVVQYD
ncbi:VOC family protein [Octadecabacter sp. CECT 8868]|uniref:VOC family protein n=1 Tax=Octadecabacter algicola TaxID=2909342 RepID=UPI001F3F2542|nr:VOC family protein [Octadecabacter algicola]MCF2903841.1 VOC family protein [Octadecabacter algicola]